MELSPAILKTVKMTDFTALITLRPDGSPHLVGAWNLLPVDPQTLILSGERYVETRRNLARDPRVWILVASREMNAGYRLAGTAHESRDPADVDLVRRYWPRCSFAIRITIDRVEDLAYWKDLVSATPNPAGPGPASPP